MHPPVEKGHSCLEKCVNLIGGHQDQVWLDQEWKISGHERGESFPGKSTIR